ncbi:MAG TPA: hypothetical protein VKB32_09540 [Actinomycetota bacterium]|jgi:hypothetical protein|nr:hypothetical protein [Actinomycetota bacterium]
MDLGRRPGILDERSNGPRLRTDSLLAYGSWFDEHGGEMARGSSDVLLGTPERGKRSVAREEKGRRCAALGCETVLSTYNRSATCFVHTSPTRRPPLEGS